MDRKTAGMTVVVLAALSAGLVLAASRGLAAPEEPLAVDLICTVDDGGGADYTTIGAAVADLNCTTINVAPGVYYENITIHRSLSIAGAGVGSTVIDGNGSVTGQRVITVSNGVAATISAVTIQHGRALTDSWGGAGIINLGGILTLHDVAVRDNVVQGNGSYDYGGGVHNLGDLMIDHATIAGNVAPAGGGIRSNQWLTITDSIIMSNTASVAGGGLIIYGSAALENVTISRNTAGNGGGIRNNERTVMNNCTLAGNSAGSGWAIYNASAVITLTNTIVTSPTPTGNCAGNTPVSNGHNLDSGTSCGLGSSGDQSGADPGLGPLADNGGGTWTHALLTLSPAIDAGNDIDCPAADQRGWSRPIDGDLDGVAACDIGAYELAAQAFLPLALRNY